MYSLSRLENYLNNPVTVSVKFWWQMNVDTQVLRKKKTLYFNKYFYNQDMWKYKRI